MCPVLDGNLVGACRRLGADVTIEQSLCPLRKTTDLQGLLGDEKWDYSTMNVGSATMNGEESYLGSVEGRGPARGTRPSLIHCAASKQIAAQSCSPKLYQPSQAQSAPLTPPGGETRAFAWNDANGPAPPESETTP